MSLICRRCVLSRSLRLEIPDKTREFPFPPELLRLWLAVAEVAAWLGWVETSVSDTVARAGTGEAVWTEEVPVAPPTMGGGRGSESGR